MEVGRWPGKEFLSTLPVRGATLLKWQLAMIWLFLSTLPVRGATLAARNSNNGTTFLSTLPVRGATDDLQDIHQSLTQFLSTLPVRGATIQCQQAATAQIISIHAPREGSDGNPKSVCQYLDHFYPRSP